MEKLKGSQRKWLRGQAHSLKPVVQIGKNGLTEGTLREIDLALDTHELIKVQAVASKEEKQELARQIAEELEAETVGQIGHVLILYREQEDPDKRQFDLGD
ncbi:MAG TPA: ribosome assembly RNA-binding protein YhbY [Thermoanaerobaculia bacterium]|nr:ribosome assembly RNA-binding protein YhbY [Thermoanaerobaculia bacterium]